MQRAVTLRALDARDLPALHALAAAAGWPHRVQDCAMLLSLGRGLAACAPGGTIVGSAMRWDWSADCATVGMVLVAPQQQGKGLGRRLMHALLDVAPARAVMLNATLAGLALYEKLGFRPIGMIHQHQGTATAAPPSGPGGAAGTAALAALDHAAFGAPRTALIERLQVEAELCVTPRGFAARRRFGHGHAIGPVVAETEDDAIDLIAALLRPGFHRIDVPAEAAGLRGWLTQAGLLPVDSVTVMVRGDWPRGGASVRRYALAGHAFG